MSPQRSAAVSGEERRLTRRTSRAGLLRRSPDCAVCRSSYDTDLGSGASDHRSSTDTGRLGRRRSRRVSDRRRLGFETRPHRRVSLRRVLSYLVMPLQASSGSAAREPP